jgi:hypothetical protein
LESPVIIVVWLENKGQETERLNAKAFMNNSEFYIAANMSHFNLSKKGEKRKFFKGIKKIDTKRGFVLSLISKSELELKIGENESEKWQAFVLDKLTVYPRVVVGYQVSCYEAPDMGTVNRFVDIKGHLIQLNDNQTGRERQRLSVLASEWNLESILLAINDDLKAWFKNIQEEQKDKLKRIERHESEIKNWRERQDESLKRIAALKVALAGTNT